LFSPELIILTPESKILARSMFKLMESEKTLLFPVIRKEEELVTVEWFPPKCEEQRAFFGPAENTSQILCQSQSQDSTVYVILIDLGFNLVHSCFDDLVDIMKNAGINVSTLKAQNTHISLWEIGHTY
jgi:hypothetical protein